MSNKKTWNSLSALVYSTDPNAIQPSEEVRETTPEPKSQKLRVIIDRKQRKGKTVTVVENFTGREEDLKTLGKSIKTMCGTGGNVKNGEILIQGDFKDKIIDWLRKNGYSQTK